MVEYLQYIDTRLLVYINGHHSAWLDFVMWWVSDTFIWLPFYIVLIFILYKNLGKKSIPFLLIVGVLILTSDQIAGIVKNLVHRLRPSHDPNFRDLLHYVHDYHGGQYGFVSSHAMNVFALSFYFFFVVRHDIKWLPYVLFSWAILVSISRVYLGVHFPSDILVPVLLSCPISYGASQLYKVVERRYFADKSKSSFDYTSS